jgi:predicted phosphoribosyltransferase
MSVIHERNKLRDRRRVFEDRFDGGRVLDGMLGPAYGRAEGAIVLGIPMGGVPVAVRIAAMLQCPLDLIIVRKIQIPGNSEAGFGAMTSDGKIFLNEPLVAQLGLTAEQVEREADRVRRELAARTRRTRRGRPFPRLAGRTVILVDDGLASGFTMKASIHMDARHGAEAIVVAVPTAPLRSLAALEGAASEIYYANVRQGPLFAVADAYENWYDLSESEVLALVS